MTPERAADRIRRFATDLPAAVDRGLVAAQRLARERAIWWSSGPLSAKDLRRMGHPYARAERGQPRPDPGRINIGKKRAVVEGWAGSPVETTAAGRRIAVYNTAPHARFLYDTSETPAHPDRGTKTMVGRPLPERVLAEIEPRVTALFESELDGIMGA